MAFLVLVAAPVVGQLAGQSNVDDIAVTEWRHPSEAPSWRWTAPSLKRLPKATEAWLNDVFGFRALLCSVNQRLIASLGSTTSRFVTVGRDGWLFLRSDSDADIEAEARGAVEVSEEDVDGWVQRLVAVKDWLGTAGIGFVAVIVPEKQSIYPEFLPDWARPTRPTRTDRLVARIRGTGAVDFVDTRPALAAAKAVSSDLLYYQVDTHWNHRGAFVAYQAIMEAVRARFPGANVVAGDEVAIGEELYAAHDLMRFHDFRNALKVPATNLRLTGASHAVSARQLTNGRWLGVHPLSACFDQPVTVVTTDLAAAPRALIVRDSFTNALAPFFNESFGQVMYAPHLGATSFPFVAEFAPDVVLLVVVERVIAHPLQPWASSPIVRSEVGWDERTRQAQLVVAAGDVLLSARGFEDGTTAEWDRVFE